jgi:hypothetical protein
MSWAGQQRGRSGAGAGQERGSTGAAAGQQTWNTVRIIVAITFVAGYLAGNAFPAFKTTRGITVPGWAVALACYAVVVAGAGCLIVAATWGALRVGDRLANHFDIWGAWMDAYKHRLDERNREHESESAVKL